MKRILSVLLCAVLMAFASCASSEPASGRTSGSDPAPAPAAVSGEAEKDAAGEDGPSTAIPGQIHTAGSEIDASALAHRTDDESAPVVYFTADISPDALVRIFDTLDWNPAGKVAVKISTGESERSNHLKPALIEPLVTKVNGTIVECMTAYGGNRAEIARAKQAAEDHGYTAVAPFDLMDEEGEIDVPVTGGKRIERAIVGSHVEDYDAFLVLSHFKGHAMAGFGGAIKNVGIGMSSKSGKVLVHSAGTRTSGSIFHSDQDAWLEALAEMVKGMEDYMGEGGMVYVSVMNRLSVDCDCDGNPAEPDMHDIGILASTDPVALDQACVDFIYAAPDGQSVVKRIERQNGTHTLEHAEEIGLGSRAYRLVSIDD